MMPKLEIIYWFIKIYKYWVMFKQMVPLILAVLRLPMNSVQEEQVMLGKVVLATQIENTIEDQLSVGDSATIASCNKEIPSNFEIYTNKS